MEAPSGVPRRDPSCSRPEVLARRVRERFQRADVAVDEDGEVLVQFGRRSGRGAGVEFLDSTGLGVLVGCLKRVRANHGSLHLVCNQPRLLKIFSITGLMKSFAFHDTLESALAVQLSYTPADVTVSAGRIPAPQVSDPVRHAIPEGQMLAVPELKKVEEFPVTSVAAGMAHNQQHSSDPATVSGRRRGHWDFGMAGRGPSVPPADKARPFDCVSSGCLSPGV